MNSPATRDFYFLTRLRDEVSSARHKHASYNSLHEAYGVLLEEVAEFFDEVRKQTAERDPEAILTELIQIAAVAQRAATELPALYNGAVPHGTISPSQKSAI